MNLLTLSCPSLLKLLWKKEGLLMMSKSRNRNEKFYLINWRVHCWPQLSSIISKELKQDNSTLRLQFLHSQVFSWYLLTRSHLPWRTTNVLQWLGLDNTNSFKDLLSFFEFGWLLNLSTTVNEISENHPESPIYLRGWVFIHMGLLERRYLPNK